jgi:DNA-binding transcriptional LysR family regulator
MTLVSVTAYHSFSGEVEALNTPTIRRLTPSCRHQLSRIARIRLAAAKEGPWARRRKIDLAELIEEPWITVPSDHVGSSVLVDAFRAGGLQPPRIAVTTYSIHLRNSLAASARFIAALPDSVLHFSGQNLRELPIDLPTPPWSVVIVTAKRRTPNPVAERFIACAREVAKSFADGPRLRKSGST